MMASKMMASNRIMAFLNRLQNLRRNGSGWMALCPSHDDRKSSLSIGQGDDGRILLHCFAGCHAEQVVAAVGLTMADLFEQHTTNGKGDTCIPLKRVQQCNAQAAPLLSTRKANSYRLISLWDWA